MRRPTLPEIGVETIVTALWFAGISLLGLGAGLSLGAGVGLALAGALLLVTATLFAKGTA